MLPAARLILICMRSRETVDAELRLLAVARRSISQYGGTPSVGLVDELLDERLKNRTRLELVHDLDALLASPQRCAGT